MSKKEEEKPTSIWATPIGYLRFNGGGPTGPPEERSAKAIWGMLWLFGATQEGYIFGIYTHWTLWALSGPLIGLLVLIGVSRARSSKKIPKPDQGTRP